MKKLFSKLVAFCLGLFVSISIYACADDFKDPTLMGSEELQSLKELVAKYYDEVTRLSDEVKKLSDEVVNLKTTSQQQESKIAELTERVTELEKGDCVTYYKDKSPEGDWYSATFNYDAEGRIISVIYNDSYGGSNTKNVSYTETGCTIGGKTITGTTQRALNRAIMAWYFD